MTNLLGLVFSDPGLLEGCLSPSSCKLCIKLQSGPRSHFPLFKKSKQTPLIQCSIASISCRKWHFSPRGQEPEDTNLKHILSPSPPSCFCRFWATSYLQYWESEIPSLDLFVLSSGEAFFSIDVYGDEVVFVVFMAISVEDMVDAGVGEIAWINFWNEKVNKILQQQKDIKYRPFRERYITAGVFSPQ